MEYVASNQSENPHWETERIFFNNDEYYDSLLEGIRSAKSSVMLEVYIFARSQMGDRFCQALCEARDRGVSVKLLVDGIGSLSFIPAYEDILKAHKVEVHLYRSIPWDFRTHSQEPFHPVRRILNRFYRLNHGTHRKYCLVDNRRLWAGSLNICDEHSERIMGDQAWKDVGLYVEGPAVSLVKNAFMRSYDSKPVKEIKSAAEQKLVLLNQTRPLKRAHRSVQLRHAREARARIWIETPYFVPIARVLRLLLKKKRDGVDVRIIVPQRGDVWITRWISYTYLFQLARHGVQVYEYEPRFLHSKIFVIDNWVCVGSTNLNHRSFLHDLEMDVVLTTPKAKDRVVQQLLDDMAASVPLNKDIWSAFPWWKRLLSRALSVFSYWS